ncbi:glycoprotein precursor [Groundnut chlorotic fan-spot virus]|uniref:Envelopment polyprotein n=1 Tax=Groundnut chlorotic fan-spot virus TaxID=1629551 RepID=A0A0D4D8M7_9VIRU|nr:glycoprotein precursor [Groundnut chlorotic fan-spot virus]AJT59691.1 glycoprotein precursor [Groundnut chlorotic fan-spot virus]
MSSSLPIYLSGFIFYVTSLLVIMILMLCLILNLRQLSSSEKSPSLESQSGKKKYSGTYRSVMLSDSYTDKEKCRYTEQNHEPPLPSNCMIVGKSTFNFLATMNEGDDYYTCPSENVTFYKKCKNINLLSDFNSEITIPVVPVMNVENKRLLEVGSKYFEEKIGSKQHIVLHSVKLSGDCNISQLNSDETFNVNLETTEKLIGVTVKQMGQLDSKVQSFTGTFQYQLSEDSLDGFHYLICGDKFFHLPNVDNGLRRCVHKYQDNKTMLYTCVNFYWLKWAFLFFLIMMPITWIMNKTKGPLSLWYDLLSIVLYPLIYLLNNLWSKMPYRCDMCGYLSLLSHDCPPKCVCGRSDSGALHNPDCYFNRGFPKKPSKKFQFLMNTGITRNVTFYLTRFMLSTIVISILPNTLALQASCGYNCYADLEQSKFLYIGSHSMPSARECDCKITKDSGSLDFPFKVVETYKDITGKTQTNIANKKCYPDFDDDCADHLDTEVLRILACAYSCEALKMYIYEPLPSVHESYKGEAYGKMKPIDLYSLQKSRTGVIDNRTILSRQEPSLSTWEKTNSVMSKAIASLDKLDVSSISDSNTLSRTTLMYSSKVDGKYRYMIEQDLISDTGTVFEMVDGTMSHSKKLMITHKNVGVTYTIEYLYTTADIVTTKTSIYSSCTGNCEKCWEGLGSTDNPSYHKFCLEPTSQWGCEDFMCIAMNEGSTCGHCDNVYDMSNSLDVYRVKEVHVSSTACVNAGKGYNCFNHDDRKAYTNDNYQVSITSTLQNDYISVGHKLALAKDGSAYTGNIADLMSADMTFGHPQLNKQGELLFAEEYIGKEQLSWDCEFIGPKKVYIKKCGFYTFDHFSGLEKLNEGSFVITGLNKITMLKDYSLGKIKTVLDLPIELFVETTEAPKVNIIDHFCSGCLECFKGLDCKYKINSNKHFASRISSDFCVSKHQYLIVERGSNEISMNLHCGVLPENAVLKMIVEDNENISLDIPLTKIEIINDKNVETLKDHRIQKSFQHKEDTDFHTFLETVTYPFNWVANFTNSALDLLKLALLFGFIILGLYVLSKCVNLGKEAYSHATIYIKKKKHDDNDSDVDDSEMYGEKNLVRRLKYIDL